jgi:hypothetical protein
VSWIICSGSGYSAMKDTRNLSIRITDIIILAAIGVMIGGMVSLALTPPYARDALIHHLAVPKLWMKHGGFYETPWAIFSYYPMNIELLYLLCLLIGWDILPKLVHLGFALGTGLLIYRYAKVRLGRRYALLGLLLWLSTPIVIYVGTIAYIDLGITFFITLALLALARFGSPEAPPKKSVLLMAVSLGLAIGSKYTALIALPFFLGCLFIAAARKYGSVKATRYLLALVVVAGLVGSPWYLKNLYLQGNPLYPFRLPFTAFSAERTADNGAEASLSQRNGAQIEVGGNTLLKRRLLYNENMLEILSVPLRIFWQGKDNDARYFDGVLSIFYLVFLPFAWFERRERGQVMLFLTFSWFFILMVFFLQNMRIRYIMPALPPLLIVNLIGAKHLIENAKTPVKALAIFAVGALTAMNFHYLGNRLNTVKPWRYVFGLENRDQFLMRTVGSYPAVTWINTHLPHDSKVLFLMAGQRGYYCEREYRIAPLFGQRILDKMVETKDCEELERLLSRLGVTHLFSNHYLVFNYLAGRYSDGLIQRLRINMDKSAEKLYQGGPYSVLALFHNNGCSPAGLSSKQAGHHE